MTTRHPFLFWKNYVRCVLTDRRLLRYLLFFLLLGGLHEVVAQGVLPDSVVRDLIRINRKYVNIEISGPRDYDTVMPLVEAYDYIADPKLKADAAYVLGHYHLHLLDAENGLKYFTEAGKLYKQSGEWGLYVNVMKDFCNASRMAGNFTVIEPTLKACLELAREHEIGFYILNPLQELTIHLSYTEHRFSEAAKYGIMFMDTLKKYEALGVTDEDFRYSEAVDARIVDIELGHCYLYLGQYDKAQHYLRQAEAFFLPRNDNEKLARIYRHLAVLANYRNHPELAREYLTKFDEYTAKFQKEQIKVLYKLPKLTRDIYTLKQAYLESRKEVEELEQRNYLIAGFSALALILLLYFFWLQRKAKLHQEKVNAFLRREFEMSEMLNEEKTKYFSILSHELRTPIFAITGLARLMGTAGNDTKENIDAIINSGNHLLHLVNNVLQHNKLETAEQIALDEIDFELVDALEEVIQTTSYLAGQKDISIHFNNELAGAEYVKGDLQKLNQIMVNLISNAIRYSHRGGKVEVIVRNISTDETTGKYYFSVRDHGVGIEKEDIEGLFDYRKTTFGEKAIDNPENLKGMGIGLFVVANFVAAMGSEIHVESEAPMGTVFYFEVNFKKSTPIASTRENDLLGSSGVNILVVDDIKVNLIVTKKTLSSIGLNCVTATDVDPVLKIIKEQHIDLILMDLNMPSISGYELSRKIRKAGYKLPIIAHTAVIKDHIDLKMLHEAGIQDYLIKPYPIEELKEKLSQYLNIIA